MYGLNNEEEDDQRDTDEQEETSDRRLWITSLIVSLVLAIIGCMGPVVVTSLTNPGWERAFDPALLGQSAAGGFIIGLAIGLFGGAGARQSALQHQENPRWYRQQWYNWTIIYAALGAAACVIISILYLTYIM